MNDIIVKISKATRDASPSKSFIGVDGENLVENLIFIFTDSFVDGEARLEYIVDNAKYFINLEKEDEKYFIKVDRVMTKSGNIPMQLVIQKSIDDDTLIFKSEIFRLLWRVNM